MEDVEAWARMLLALDRHTDDLVGERAAVLEWIDLTLNGGRMKRTTFYLDLLERTLWSFVQGFAGGYVGVLFVDSLNDLPTSARLATAAGTGIVAVMKGLVVNQLPWTANNSASTLPAEVDPPANG